jgi:hypothetical protein
MLFDFVRAAHESVRSARAFSEAALEQKAIPDRCRFGAAGAIREKTVR